MKAKKIILFIVFVLGILGLLLMASFTTRNACEYANSNLEYIKSQTQAAIIADDFEMSKYYAYKALNGIEKTKFNFIDCGCEGTIESLEKTLSYLKKATKAASFEVSKKSLHNALESTEIGIKVLKTFEEEFSSTYDNNVLVLNTKNAIYDHGAMLLTHGKLSEEQVHSCLLGFENSLDKVIREVDCKSALKYITRIHEEARLTLLNTGLSEPKKQYHQRVKTITHDALLRIGECNVD
ncbi:hypothetical protein [Flagellimonas pacifica]|uniref:Uncharacterized protein n=1 Tax=Flagellimonas pacifica TaxID=1247520 RepID=A0A285MUJ3_9FLAO|nr:hypothetical protein [Allomuricauda parva]SNZ00217.1 hypothetical protein SAMN06265377_2037 [Allomuricauda parva]